MEYCCHIWAGAPACHLSLLDGIQRRIANLVGHDLASSLEHKLSRLSLSEKYGSGRTMKSPWFSLNHISHLATVEVRVVRLGSFQNLYLSFAMVEITHGVTANRDDINSHLSTFWFPLLFPLSLFLALTLSGLLRPCDWQLPIIYFTKSRAQCVVFSV